MKKDYKLSNEIHEELAVKLYEAEKNNTPIELLTKTYPELTVDDAYAIQQHGLRLREAESSVKVIGRKIGITSKGMMKLLNCDSPDYGYLLANTEITEGSPCISSDLHMPMIEGELAFVIGEDLIGDSITVADITSAISWVIPCFEICDTRYHDWKLTVEDTIADNAAASRFMLGAQPKKLNEINPKTIGMVMEKNGSLVGSATGAEVMGSPITSITWLAKKLMEYGTYLRKGNIVLSGSFLAGDMAKPGDVYTMTMDGFAPLTLRVE